MRGNEPFIVTLLLDEESFRFFENHRRRYFPPERNFLQAHLTLFHHLPSTEQKIKDDLLRLAERSAPFYMNVTDVVSIGKGVAYKIESPQLQRAHQEMQREWQQWLRPQDKQKLWPHVTVQNKVSPQVATQTLEILQSEFQPFTVQALGFSLWHYEEGPWSFETVYRFREAPYQA